MSALTSEEDPLYNNEATKPVETKLRLNADSITGALNYSYPITIPPGRNGLQPELNLNYNSQNEDNSSLFGYGWSINIPYIERINRKGSDKLYSENFYNSSLSGELLRLGTTTEYRSKIDDGDFLKYNFVNNSYWQVVNKNGIKFIYGSSTASRKDNPASSTQIFKWMLEKVIDVNNNYILYDYIKERSEIYPYKIKYTGSNNTDGLFEIEFIKESRPDVSTSTNSGFQVVTAFRINQIQAKFNGALMKQYDFGYGSGDNGYRSLLSSVIESGKDEQDTITVLPATHLSYQKKAKNWVQSFDSNIPIYFANNDVDDMGVRQIDVNGDSLVDIVQSWTNGELSYKAVYINKGDGTGWQLDTNWSIPVDFVTRRTDVGVRFADVNGDGLIDIIKAYAQVRYGSIREVYLNKGDGTGWQQDINWSIPVDFAYNDNIVVAAGTRLEDINGDGLADIIQSWTYLESTQKAVYLNKGDGTGWQQDGNWSIPIDFSYSHWGDIGVRLVDVNGDGLVDILQSFSNAPYGDYIGVYINKGNGMGWQQDDNWSIPIYFANNSYSNLGVQLADINADGLIDIIQSWTYEGWTTFKGVYLNKGNNTGWLLDNSWSVPIDFAHNHSGDIGTRLLDMNGDGLLDIVQSYSTVQSVSTQVVFLANKQKADTLSFINHQNGYIQTILYKNTAEYLNASSSLLNPKLPINLQTVFQISNNDGRGNVSTSTYLYSGGQYYYNSAYDKKFSGFGGVVITDPLGNTKKSYYHQGNITSSSTGEYEDHISKAGMVYRTESYDNSGNLYSKTINKWDKYDLGNGRHFVKLIQSVDSIYDGDATHKDKASTYLYDNLYGNKIQETNWGEVVGSDNGTFSDTGSDLASTSIVYVASTTPYIVGLPDQKATYDQSGNKVKDTKYYYDNLSFGNVGIGNMTKQEDWKSGSTYINIQKTYNTYGLVTQDKDARGKNTNYIYDSYNLYIATSTNPLNRSIQLSHDYSSGKTKKVVDSNGRIFESVYDGLDRIVAEKQPDINNPSSLVTKTSYDYFVSTSSPNYVHQTNYLTATSTFDSYVYSDGLDRQIQTRVKAENENNYMVKDFSYDKNGQLASGSLPYFSTGTSLTEATTTNMLFTRYAYDPLQRVKSMVNVVGTTSYAYNDWKTSVTDPLGHVKDLFTDAYGNLIKVDEHIGTNTNSTIYQYNLSGNLLKITDALNNVRNFSYDGLGRLLKSEDLHVVGDSTFGSSTMVYDDSSNISSKVNAKNQVINYSYDDLNRPLTEDFAGQSGVEIVYGYDNCADGVGRLCSATSSGAITNYTYNPLGMIKSENRLIGTTTFITQYVNDIQGNVASIVYPDNAQVKYSYNSAGQLESVSKKESSESSFTDLVSDYDYNPMNQVVYTRYGNNAETYNSYDPNELYRLKNKYTLLPDDGGVPSGQQAMRSADLLSVALEDGVLLSSDSVAKTKKISNFLSSASDKVKSDYDTAMKKNLAKNENLTHKSARQPIIKPVLKNALDLDFVGPMLLNGNSTPKYPVRLKSDGWWFSVNILNNSSFEIGFSDWNFETAVNSTHSEDCTTSYSGSCSEKMVVTTPGDNWWDTEIWQNMRVDESNYTLKFKAKALASTTIAFGLIQNYDPWYDYGLNKEGIAVGTSWKEYSYTFTSWASDEDAKLYFDTGKFASTVWLDDIELVPDQVDKLKNTSFEHWDDYWDFYSFDDEGVSGTWDLICNDSTEGDCSKKIDINTVGENWYVQLVQGMSIDVNDTYVVSFDAKATSGSRPISVVLNQLHDPYDMLSDVSTVNLSSQWQHYTTELVPYGTDATGSIIFLLGDYAPDMLFDNIHVYKKQNTKLDNPTPDFSMVYDDSDASDTASYYQLQVVEKGNDFTTPVWDSGKTALSPNISEGNRTSDISFGGGDLPIDGKKYYWRVKLWDVADAESPWTNGRDYFQMYGTPAQDINYYYDKVGNITKIDNRSYTNAAKTTNYAYDDLYRLTAASTTNSVNRQNYNQTYSYNAIGNILNKSDIGNYSYNGNQGTNYANPNAATTINSITNTYDNNGNLTNDGQWTHAWTYNNLLATSTKGTTTIRYTYDHDNNRVRYSINNTATTTTVNKYYSITNATSTKYIYANGSLLATLENGNTYYDHTDHLSGSNIITDQNQKIQEVLDYYPFGSIMLDEKQSSFNEKKKFAGHEYDAENGLNYMVARYQNGGIGRFLLQDPVFLSAGNSDLLKQKTGLEHGH